MQQVSASSAKVTRTTRFRGSVFKVVASATGAHDVEVSVHDEGDNELGRLTGRLPRPALHVAAQALTALAGMGRPPVTANTRIDRLRRTYPNAYQPWTGEDDQRLTTLYDERTPIRELSQLFGRQTGAILARLRLLGLLASPGDGIEPPL